MKPNESPAASAPEAANPFRWAASSSDQQQRPEEVRDLFQPVQTPPHEPITSSAPPWTDTETPPLAEQQSEWLRQGSGMFPTPAGQSRSKQIIGLTVLAVVVLGLVGATVAYSLTSGPGRADSDQIAPPLPNTAPRDLPAPPAQLPPPVDTADALIDPPGQPRGNESFDLAQLSPKLLPNDHIRNALWAGAMTGGVFKGTTVGANEIGMLAFTMPDQQAAAKVAGTIINTEFHRGLKIDNTRAMQGVAVMGSVSGSENSVYRAVYVLYNRTIFFEVLGKNRDEVLATFDSLLKDQVTHAPPTVR
ncbi:MAG: hypothetical protein ACRDQ4_25030 [Pseudonocardiaceae bacterium]